MFSIFPFGYKLLENTVLFLIIYRYPSMKGLYTNFTLKCVFVSCQRNCDVCVCVCGFWPLVWVPRLNYEVAGFQPQTEDATDLVSVHALD